MLLAPVLLPQIVLHKRFGPHLGLVCNILSSFNVLQHWVHVGQGDPHTLPYLFPQQFPPRDSIYKGLKDRRFPGEVVQIAASVHAWCMNSLQIRNFRRGEFDDICDRHTSSFNCAAQRGQIGKSPCPKSTTFVVILSIQHDSRGGGGGRPGPVLVCNPPQPPPPPPGFER